MGERDPLPEERALISALCEYVDLAPRGVSFWALSLNAHDAVGGESVPRWLWGARTLDKRGCHRRPRDARRGLPVLTTGMVSDVLLALLQPLGCRVLFD